LGRAAAIRVKPSTIATATKTITATTQIGSGLLSPKGTGAFRSGGHSMSPLTQWRLTTQVIMHLPLMIPVLAILLRWLTVIRIQL
jgi:hypothetical protein